MLQSHFSVERLNLEYYHLDMDPKATVETLGKGRGGVWFGVGLVVVVVVGERRG